MVLYLLPNVFDDHQPIELLLPIGLPKILEQLDGLIGESERSARRFLVKVLGGDTSRSMPIFLLNEHSSAVDIQDLLEKMSGKNFGLVSDCGLPIIADPGSNLVSAARKRGITIKAIPGPSSIFLALMMSGMNAQHFVFHGYVPKDDDTCVRQLRQMEKDRVTHIFIEAPYRNQALLTRCISTLSPTTLFAVGSQLTLPDESFECDIVQNWKKRSVATCRKVPSIFLLQGVV